MSEEIEVKAKQMGWVPEAEFRGDRAKWIDAKSYVERGEQVLPILQANNRRLMDTVQQLQAKTAQQDEVIKNATASIEELKNFNSEMTRSNAKDQKEQLKAQLVQAKKDNDAVAEVELTDKLSELNTTLRTAEKEPVKETVVKQPDRPVIAPEFQQWMNENPWYATDPAKAGFANGIAQELRRDPANEDLKGKAFFDRVSEELEKRLSVCSSSRESERPV